MTNTLSQTKNPELTAELLQQIVDESPLVAGTPEEIAEVLPYVRKNVAAIIENNTEIEFHTAILMALGAGE